jgi:hypothetical protein
LVDDGRGMDALPPDALLEAFAPPIRSLAQELRALVAATVPEATERVRSGWRILGYDLATPSGRRSRTTFFAWVMAERRHVHLGFVHGTLLADPDGRLDGRGVTRRARWLTYAPGEAVDVAVARGFLLDAAAIARREPRERAAELALAAAAGD